MNDMRLFPVQAVDEEATEYVIASARRKRNHHPHPSPAGKCLSAAGRGRCNCCRQPRGNERADLEHGDGLLLRGKQFTQIRIPQKAAPQYNFLAQSAVCWGILSEPRLDGPDLHSGGSDK